jgi:hypothetical protein
MGGACSTYERDHNGIQNFYGKTQKGGDHSDGLGANSEITLELMLGK